MEKNDKISALLILGKYFYIFFPVLDFRENSYIGGISCEVGNVTAVFSTAPKSIHQTCLNSIIHGDDSFAFLPVLMLPHVGWRYDLVQRGA